MAYLRPITRPRCRCGKPATVELINARNASGGTYCRSCGRRAALRLQDAEAAAAKESTPRDW